MNGARATEYSHEKGLTGHHHTVQTKNYLKTGIELSGSAFASMFNHHWTEASGHS